MSDGNQRRSALPGSGGQPSASSSASQAGERSRSAQPAAPQPQRRSSGSLPGLSSMASSLRSRRSSSLSQSSLGRTRRNGSSDIVEEEDGEEDGKDIDDGGSDGRPDQGSGSDAPISSARVDPSQLDEIRKGISMPGLGGIRANTLDRQQQGDTKGPKAYKGITTRDNLGTEHGSRAAAGESGGVLVSGQLPPTGSRSPHTVAQNYSDQPYRSRAQPTLKASMLKKRMPTAAGMAASSAAAASAKKAPSGPRIGQGTPARATRYSLPVRAEKPVRTSKMTGRHVVLPSESQLAPLPGEEEEEDDDDDDDDDESSEDDSDAEVASHADEDENLPEEGDEETREQARQAAKRRREEKQAQVEEARKEKAAQRQARKPKGAPGHPEISSRDDDTKAKLLRATSFRGPAHARAPPRVPKSTGPVYHTFERLAPSARVHTPLPRLTSYAVAPAIHLPTLNGFLRREHSVKPRLYDECAYVVYFKPLLPGFGRALVRSSPEPRTGSPGAESRREREIVEREESGYVGSYFVNASKDDEGDIDDQGYIHGGEGQGQEEEEDTTIRHLRQQESRRGDVTETDGETEREDTHRRRRAADASETETETEIERESGRTIDSSHDEKDNSHNRNSRKISDDQVAASSYEDHEEVGLRTPRPARTAVSGDELQTDELPALGEPALPSPQENVGELSNADVAGAQDLLHQQHLIEQGTDDPQGMPEQRSALSDQENEGRQRVKSGGSVNGGNAGSSNRTAQRQREREDRRRQRRERKRAQSQGPNLASHNHDTTMNMLTSRSVFEALQVAELIILPYGVLVMYNFTEAEERDIISDVISSGCVRGGPALTNDDEETEAFHFCYDPSVPAPRIFNDFFTFRGPNHLLKLSLAHAIAQSTKLSVFEESMQRTLELTSHIPKELALSGELQLKRREALKLTGRLFKLRVDVNLTSNVLDTPELFWSEASLKALYDAIREYLEIDQRVENLNERLAVGNDLLEVIHDHLGSQSMNQITWIIIILIVVACIVACGEISARLVLHARTRQDAVVAVTAALSGRHDIAAAAPVAALPGPSDASLSDATSMRQMYYLLLTAAKVAAESASESASREQTSTGTAQFLIQQ